MTIIFKELADGLREAARGLTLGGTHYLFGIERSTIHLKGDNWANPVAGNKGEEAFLQFCRTHAPTLLEALERAAKLEILVEEAELDSDAVLNIRRITKAATGGNCTFVDDDVRLIVRQRDDAMEQASKLRDALTELISHHSEDEGMEDEPYDEAVGWVWNEDDGDHTKPMSLTFGVLRRARAALKGGETA